MEEVRVDRQLLLCHSCLYTTGSLVVMRAVEKATESDEENVCAHAKLLNRSQKDAAEMQGSKSSIRERDVLQLDRTRLDICPVTVATCFTNTGPDL